jgi:hypothetical protein
MEKTAVKPPWKSLRDSHFPHSPGDDGAFHFTKNTSSAESAIYPQISRTKLTNKLVAHDTSKLTTVPKNRRTLSGGSTHLAAFANWGSGGRVFSFITGQQSTDFVNRAEYHPVLSIRYDSSNL